MATHLAWGRLAAVAATVAIAQPALALDIGGGISIGAIYSDNVTLAPSGQEDGDTIFRADPSIFIASVGRLHDFRLDYTLEALHYQDRSDSSAYSQGNAKLDLSLVPEHLFLNSTASIAQVVINPEAPFSNSNLPEINNRTDAVRYQVGPQWRQDFLGTSLNVRYDVGRVNYDDKTLQDSDYQTLQSDWTGPDKAHGLTWAVHHEYEKYDYDFSPSAERQLAELSLILEMDGGWAPFVSGGMESDIHDRTSASLEDGIWRAGLRRKTERTFFEAYAGERSFGSSWGASFQRQYTARSGDILRLSYSETPRTNEDLSGTLSQPVAPAAGTQPDGTASPEPPAPVIPTPVVPPDANGPGTGRYYLDKRAEFLLAKAFSRNSVSLNVFYSDEETLDQGPAQDSDDTRQAGASLVWVYNIGVRTRSTVDGYYARRRFSRVLGPEDSDDLVRTRLTLTYQLGARTDINGWVAREERSGSDIGTNNYTENQVGLAIGRTF